MFASFSKSVSASTASAFSLAPFVHLLNPASRNTSNTKMTTAMKSPAFYKNDLEARTDFVCDRHKFLRSVVDAVLLEEMDDDARRFLELFTENGYTSILLRLLKDKTTDVKTRKKILLTLGNLLASVNPKVSSAAVLAVNKDMEPVFEALNSMTDKIRNGAAFVVMNFAKHKWDGEIEVALRNLNDTHFYAQAGVSALRDILWAYIHSKNEELLSYTNLVKILAHADLRVVYPALVILADRTEEPIPAEFRDNLMAILQRLVGDRAVKGEVRQWAYFNLANLLAEDAADHEQFLNDDMLTVLTRDITNHFEVGEDHHQFATEALWCVANVIAKHTPNPFKLMNLYTFHDLTRILNTADCALDDYTPSARKNTMAQLIDESFATLRRHRETMSPSAVYDFLRRELEQSKNVIWAGRREAIFAELHRLLNREESMVEEFLSDIPLLLTMSAIDNSEPAAMMEQMRLLAYAVLDADADRVEIDVEAATIVYEMLKRLSTRLPTFLVPQTKDAFAILDEVFDAVEAENATVEAEEDEDEDEDEDFPDFNKVCVHWFTHDTKKRFIEVPYTDLCAFLAESECPLGANTTTVYWRLMPNASYSQATVSLSDLSQFVTLSDVTVHVDASVSVAPKQQTKIFHRVFVGPNQSYCVKVEEFDVFIRKYFGSGSHRIWFTNEDGAERSYFVSEESIKDLAALEGASIAIVMSAKEAEAEADADSVEDMEIDDDASASSMPHLESSPASEPAVSEDATFNCFDSGFYVSSAIDLMLGFGRFNASRTVFELINCLAANNCAPTPIPADVRLSAADMVMLERLGYILNRGFISVNPYVTMAVAPIAGTA